MINSRINARVMVALRATLPIRLRANGKHGSQLPSAAESDHPSFSLRAGRGAQLCALRKQHRIDAAQLEPDMDHRNLEEKD